MKIHFTPEELAYMNVVIQALQKRVGAEDERAARTLQKMKYKFTPNATLVSLTAREREMLDYVFGYRASALEHASVESGEYKLATAIREKVAYGYTDGNAT